ncbi:MAG: enoyl-CoA hydratase/isomerase family protein [Chloroflexi bacterium]|nr:enoyl-CoA hydratase/isomerase family protein [Chloroflexota bacterium]
MAEHPSTLLLTRDGPIATLRLNRPEHGNAVDDPTMDRLIAALEELAAAEGLRIIQVRGEGHDFCAGRHAPPTLRSASAGAIARNLQKIIRANALLARQSAVTVAVVRGRALGFGCGLAAQCDLTLAADDARLAFPEIRGGLPPAIVLSWLPRWIPRKKALELAMTAREMDAGEACALGLVNHVYPPAELDAAVGRWCDLLLGMDAAALTTCKRFLATTEGMSRDQAAELAVQTLATLLAEQFASAKGAVP